MKNTVTLLMLTIILSGVVAIQSCKDDEDEPNTPAPQEFIATSTTFQDFETWSLDAINVGPSPSLGSGHAGNDSTVTRNVYFNNGQDRVNGTYPIGTIIAKRSTNPAGTVDEIVGMAKRGNGFNTAAGNWEWFMLNVNGTIAVDSTGTEMRGGANFMGGSCNSCHAGASANDFTFSK
ncbi:MAG: hypothetical protein KBH11_07950 [Bacteroidia bacterium]|nr:hypothetical protein [Bacteroidota bacterium]MBP9082994.1 hypothetical protein [Bacteroidia bacterium]MBK7969442.1 hypothetical protein [Bacteroidota bacterium]MBK8413041.1 hypothetical protein [Bacteroidota bacterium]MBK8874416.1 hypothetical protein [Bacteroidota bacterium]